MSSQNQPVSAQTRFAVRRLHRDWKELEQSLPMLPTIRALPTSNIGVWHCNLRPDEGPFAGTIFHLVLRFPVDYPHSPPDVELCTHINHPNVWDWRATGYALCLDMIQAEYTHQAYVGWTSAYSVLSILLQLQSFLFAENIPQHGGYSETVHRSQRSLKDSISAARNFSYEVETHDGTLVKHTHANPWPPLPALVSGGRSTLPLHRGYRLTSTQVRSTDNTHNLSEWVAAAMRSSRQQQTVQNAVPVLQQRPYQYKGSDFPSLGEETASIGTVSTATNTSLSVDDEPKPDPPTVPLELGELAVQKTNKKQKLDPSVLVPATTLMPELYTNIFSFLDPKGLLRVRDVCSKWRKVVITYNLFERSQIQCFHSKATLDDDNTILGVGLKVEYYPDGKSLKSATSPLDLLSQEAFDEEGVRTGVWGGESERFTHFLPLILNSAHAAKAIDRIEQTIYDIMKHCVLPSVDVQQPKQQRHQRQYGQRHRQNRRQAPAMENVHHARFHPLMAFQLLATLMNSMVVELMNSAEPRGYRSFAREGAEIQRHASEKALEGYCAFHHMLLYFAKRYPFLIEFADKKVNQFLTSEYCRHKGSTPNLGVLLVCLTLSRRGWEPLRRPLVMEAFDRNVRWILQEYPRLSGGYVDANDRLNLTFAGSKTSLRLLMFQTLFMAKIGRPAGSQGPFSVLDRYNKQMGKPTTGQKEDLQKNAKEILAVVAWPQFFFRLGGPVPTAHRLVQIFKDAVNNSARKKYHRW